MKRTLWSSYSKQTTSFNTVTGAFVTQLHFHTVVSISNDLPSHLVGNLYGAATSASTEEKLMARTSINGSGDIVGTI